MKVLLKVFVGLCFIIVLFVYLAMSHQNSSRSPQSVSSTRESTLSQIEDAVRDNGRKSQTSSTIPETPIKVSPYRLLAAYENNEVSADMTYKGKLLITAGIIEEIGKDFLHSPYIMLSTDRTLNAIQCSFPKSQEPVLAQLNKGQAIAIIGRCSGKTLTFVGLQDCSIYMTQSTPPNSTSHTAPAPQEVPVPSPQSGATQDNS